MKSLLTWVRIGLLRLHGWWLILFNRLLRRKIQLLKNDLWQRENHPTPTPRPESLESADAKKPLNPFRRTPRP